MSCTCVICPECGGTGNVWVSFSGEYLGRHPVDDLDDLESCPACDGSGILEMCEECAEEALER